jgi:hypothetical protein
MNAPRISSGHAVFEDLQRMAHHKDLPWLEDAFAIARGIDTRSEYGFDDLAEICGKPKADVETLRAAGFLSSCSHPIFELCFHVMFAGSRLYLDIDRVNALLDGLDITHPITGEAMKNPQAETYIRYRLRPGL